jgi:hypothetical protein
MSSKREQILSALVTLLIGSTSAGSNVFRSRAASVTRDETPAIIVRPEEDVPEKQFAGVTIDLLTVAVDVYTRGDVPDQLADPVIAAAHTLIMADPTIGGLAAQIIKGPSKWEDADADQTAGKATFLYHVKYTTSIGNLSA